MTAVLPDRASVDAERAADAAQVLGGTRLGVIGGILRVPLLGKLLGANLLIVVGGIVAQETLPSSSTTIALAMMLVLSFAATAALVWLALRPIVQLKATAARVFDGDFSARVPVSALADKQIAKLSATMNQLLDRVDWDRARIQHLAGRSVRARDVEREFIARELRESLAQSVSGIALKLAAAAAVNHDPKIDGLLCEARQQLHQITDDMRSIAETLYPGTLQEFGLTNALEALARRVSRRAQLLVVVDAGLFNVSLSPKAASALYRVAEEALRNAEQHARAHNVRVTLRSNGKVSLAIDDDGRGFDMRTQDPLQSGLGLFSAKTVLALVGGELQISTAPDRGTRVEAHVPTGGTQ